MPRPHLDIDAWSVTEPVLDLQTQDVTESLFALGNGYLGMRGSLDEGAPSAHPGTYMAGVFENHPLSYPEGGYGHPEHGEAMVGVADGSVLAVSVNGAALDVRETPPSTHERTLDLRSGVLTRTVEWTTPDGTPMRLVSERLVSLVDRSASAIRLRVTAPTKGARVVVRSDLAMDESTAQIESDDPRVGEALRDPFTSLLHHGEELGGTLVHRTKRSGITVAACVAHEAERAEATAREINSETVATTFIAELEAGETLEVIKYLAHAWSPDIAPEALAQRAQASLTSSRERGWDGLARAQRERLDEFWETADVEVDGDPELQQALRYNLFQLLGASACTSDAPIGAKGLTGSGYSGHTFWDTEGFILPALTLLHPQAAARLLRWRASGLDIARNRAEVLDVAGATFPWRTISGHETSAYWPASTAAMHINADVSRAFDHYVNATGESLDSVGGLEVIVETARLWPSIAHVDSRGHHFFGLTGPDEYTGVVDDNVFTNLMARRHLRTAADACAAAWDRALELGVDREEVDTWRHVADNIYVPYDSDLGVHPSNENFTSYREWRFEDKTDAYPVQEHHHYAKFYRRQVIKQADLVQAIWWCRDEFTDEEVARDLDYYEARTVRDSSLSAAVQAVVCAQAGHVDLAVRYLREAALVDLHDLQDNTAKGLHMASVAGAWFAFVAGLGGMREDHETLELSPRLPTTLSRTAYRIQWRGSLLRVETTADGTTLTVRDGDQPIDVLVDGTLVTVASGEPVRVPLRAPQPLLPEPTQPVEREPLG